MILTDLGWESGGPPKTFPIKPRWLWNLCFRRR